MKNRFFKGLLTSACLLTATACVNLDPQTDTTRWFMLDQFAVVGAYDSEFSRGETLHISRPHIPEYLNSQRIFFRNSDGSPGATQQERWAEPFSEGFARTLALRLSASTGMGSVSYYPIPRPSEPGIRVQVQVFQFEAIQGEGVIMDMIWRIDHAEGDSASERLRLRKSADRFDDVESIVRAMSELIDEAVEKIAAAINASREQN